MISVLIFAVSVSGCFFERWLGIDREEVTDSAGVVSLTSGGTISGVVNVPAAGAAKVSLKTLFKPVSGALVYLVEKDTFENIRSNFKTVHVAKTLTNASGQYQFTGVSSGLYCIVIDVDDAGGADQIVSDISPVDGKIIESYISEKNTDTSLIAINLDKDIYSHGNTLTATVKGFIYNPPAKMAFIPGGKYVHIEVWDQESDKFLWASSSQLVNNEFEATFTKTIPTGWASSFHTSRPDYRVFVGLMSSSGGGTQLLSSARFTLMGNSESSDSTAPTGALVQIAGGAAHTISRTVTLNLAATGATQMIISNTTDFSNSSWESYGATRSGWQLAAGNAGARNVYVKLADDSGNVVQVSDDITYHTHGDLLFTEYVEGSGNNKALEIYNLTTDTVDLSAGQYVVQVYSNGAVNPSATINLTGTIADNSTFVICNPSASADVLNLAQQTHGSISFNGNDTVVLRKGGAAGTVLDSIGQTGFDPGVAWTSGGVSTLDRTLRRKTTVHQGDAVIDDVFDPSVQWDGFAQDDFSNLGSYSHE